MVMKRDEMLRCLANHVDNEQIVVAAYSSAFDWISIRQSPLNYISSGPMLWALLWVGRIKELFVSTAMAAC